MYFILSHSTAEGQSSGNLCGQGQQLLPGGVRFGAKGGHSPRQCPDQVYRGPLPRSRQALPHRTHSQGCQTQRMQQ